LETTNLVERLSLQSESFQEGFDILSSALSFDEMVKNFLHLIRGNFLVSDANAFYKKNINTKWISLYPEQNLENDLLQEVNEVNQTQIYYPENSEHSVWFVLPLCDKSFLAIFIGHKLDGTSITEFDKITLQVLIQVFDSAHRAFVNQKKEKALIFDLNEKIAQMSNLIDTIIDISRFNKREVLFEASLERMTSLTCASAALVQISINGSLRKQFTFPANIGADEIINSDYKIESEFSFNNVNYKFYLVEKESRTGIAEFNELDKLLLNAITKQINTAIESDYLSNQAIEKEKLEQELLVAATIQLRILPERMPVINGYEIGGINIPSKEVGGDYFNCIDLGKDKYALMIADVAGKGISAALLVNTLDAALYSYLQFDIPLNEMADRLNKLIYKSSPSDKYITFFITILDSNTGELEILNAGHNPVFMLRSNGIMEKFDAGGVGLGMFDFGIPFTGQKSVISNGDTMFFYTDGIPEAMNDKGEEFSDERMINFFQNNFNMQSENFINALVNDVKSHTNNHPQSDDITAMILKKL